MVSNPSYSDLFESCGNVAFMAADIQNANSGFRGLFKLYIQLIKLEFDDVVDLHNTFRSKFLSVLFKLKGKRVNTYDKLRDLRNDMIHKGVILSGPHTTDQYMKAFQYLDANIHMDNRTHMKVLHKNLGNTPGRRICLAPFSTHRAKEWTLDHMAQLIDLLLEDDRNQVYCLAFDNREKEIFQRWQRKHPQLGLIDDIHSLADQMKLMSTMDIVVSMDSANMHLAALVGTPVVSIWGSTHPDLGFAPLGNMEGVIQPPPSYQGRRPLSRFGHFRNSRDIQDAQNAMASITPQQVLARIDTSLT